MTRERAIEVLDRWAGFGHPDEEYTRVGFEANINDVEEAHDMAIAALREQEERSNAQKIRAMSDEELAEFLCSVYDDEDDYAKCIEGFTIPYYDQHSLKEWLQMPVEEDA